MTTLHTDPTKPYPRNLLLLLILFFIALKIAHFALAFHALHMGIIDPQFATGYPLVAWDSKHYLDIMLHGYPDKTPTHIPETVAFFPLLPLLTRPLAAVLQPPVAMLLLCNAASFVGLLFFFAWCRRIIGPTHAFFACLFMLAYPPAMFLSAAYTESLFCAFTGTALYFSNRNKPVLAALAAGLGSATRPTGLILSFVIILDLLLKMIRGTNSAPRSKFAARRIVSFLALSLLSVSGLIIHAGYITYRYGSPLAYLHAQKNFAPQPGHSAPAETSHANPTTTSAITLPSAVHTPALSSMAKITAKLLSVGAWATLLAYLSAVLSLLILIPRLVIPRHILLLPILTFLLGYIPDHGLRVTSCARFMTCALPLFAALTLLPPLKRRPALAFPLLAAALVVQALFVIAFTRGEWAG